MIVRVIVMAAVALAMLGPQAATTATAAAVAARTEVVELSVPALL